MLLSVRLVSNLVHTYPFSISPSFIGYDMSFHPPFALIGRGGKNLKDEWSEYPKNYLSVATNGFPNLFFALGPNSVVPGASFPTTMEAVVGYAIEATLKLQLDRYKSIEVKPEAVDAFGQYSDRFFERVSVTHSK